MPNPVRPVQPATVRELIAHLQTFPQDMLVAYQCCSEAALLELSQVAIEEASMPRLDGWVHDARPDREVKSYVMFPGN